jgi:esterase
MGNDLLHCQESGGGEPVVVLLHGLFGLGSNLGALARALAPRCRVLVPDLRNHGRSFHAPGMDYRSMAGDVARLLDARDVEGVALLGHSMGGKLAMQFALDHPQRCSRLVVADIAPVAYAPHHDAMFRLLRASAVRTDADRRTTQQLLEEGGLPPEVVSLLLMHRTRDTHGEWRWRLGIDGIEAGYPEILAAPVATATFVGPVLFIKGAESDYIGPQHADAIRELFPSARLKLIAGAGHWLHAEKPQAFNRVAMDFLLAEPPLSA